VDRVPALDGIRGIAIIAVILCHAGAVYGGYLGVDLFFVLSGFLITTLLLGEWERTQEIRLRAFYRRRAARLMPGLVAMLALFFLLVAVVAGSAATLGNLTVQSVEALLYVMNFVYATGHAPNYYAHLWSLAEEEQFYLLWPPLLIVMLRKRWRYESVALLLSAAVVVFATNRILVYELGGSWHWLLASPQTRSDPILVGCLAAILYHRGHVQRFATGRAALLSLLAVVAVMSLAGFSHAAFAYGLLPFAILAAEVVLTVVDHPQCAAARILSARSLRFVGRISYSLYLWHAMFVVGHRGAALAVGLILSFGLAALSYRHVETPLRRRYAVRRTRNISDAPVNRPAAEPT